METLRKFLEFKIISIGENEVQLYSLIIVLIIIAATKLVLWLIKKTLFSKNGFKKFDKGSAYALFQIIRYIIWIIAIGFVLETIGVKVTVLIASSAALLVGVGLGLQQTFNDIISGIILLSEQSIRVDDVLEVDGTIVKIKSIGLRTSKGLNTDDISIIIPNSLITTDKVINWSHQTKEVRFGINVGVAYGSDVNLVTKLLKESAAEHPDVYNSELSDARLLNFGNSSLDFQLLFFSKSIFRIEKIKSDIRMIINHKFAENNISIPFPQMDLHFKSSYTDKSPIKM